MNDDILGTLINTVTGLLSEKQVSESVNIPLGGEPRPLDPNAPKENPPTEEIIFVLERRRFAENGIFGELMKDGYHVYFTLEHSFGCQPKVPPGTYTCVRGQHHLDSGPIETFEVTNVPGHFGILIHYGNYNADSDGCILIGLQENDVMIGNSREAFSEFMSSMQGVMTFQLIVR